MPGGPPPGNAPGAPIPGASSKRNRFSTYSLNVVIINNYVVSRKTFLKNYIKFMLTYNLDIVVAKYNEDVSWIPFFIPTVVNNTPVELRKFIYSKYENEDSSNYIKLPNIGKEAHTYLHHIINNYDNLADRVLFTQGNPFPHVEHFQSDVYSIFDFDFLPLGHHRCIDNASGYPNGYAKDPFDPNKIYNLYADFYRDLFGVASPNYFIYIYGAIFSVTREYIRSHPVQFYEKALSLMDSYNRYAQGLRWEGFMEKMWPYIFK